NLLPVRLGEFVRAYYLSRRTGVSGSAGLATIIVERVADGVTLLFFVAAAAFFIPLVGALDSLAIGAKLPTSVLVGAAALPFLGVFGGLTLVAVFPDRTTPIVGVLSRLLP